MKLLHILLITVIASAAGKSHVHVVFYASVFIHVVDVDFCVAFVFSSYFFILQHNP